MIGINDTPATGFGVDDADSSLLALMIFEGPNDFSHLKIVLPGCLESYLIFDEELDCCFALMASTGDQKAKKGLRDFEFG